jgi:hypothetical protein
MKPTQPDVYPALSSDSTLVKVFSEFIHSVMLDAKNGKQTITKEEADELHN